MTTLIDGEPLEIRLLKMPFERMFEALSAFDDLDLHLLEVLKAEGDGEAVSTWLGKLEKRRVDRRRFIELRRSLELEARYGQRAH